MKTPRCKKPNIEVVKKYSTDPYVIISEDYPAERLRNPEGFKEIIRVKLMLAAQHIHVTPTRYCKDLVPEILVSSKKYMFDLCDPVFSDGWRIMWDFFPHVTDDGDFDRLIGPWVETVMDSYVGLSACKMFDGLMFTIADG